MMPEPLVLKGVGEAVRVWAVGRPTPLPAHPACPPLEGGAPTSAAGQRSR